MARSLTFKTEDIVDDALYSITKKKGQGKGEFIRNAVKKAIVEENPEAFVNPIKEISKPNILDDLINTANSVPEKKSRIIPDDSRVSTERENNGIAIAIEKQLDIKTDINNNIPKVDDVNRLDKLVDDKVKSVDEKIEKIEKIDKPEKLEKSESNNKNKFRPRKILRKVRRMGEEQYVTEPLDIEGKVERISRKLRDQEEFNKSFKDMHGKVDEFCKDGKCLRDDVDELKNKMTKIDEICENGKCIKDEVSGMKELFKNLSKEVGDLKNNVGGIDKKIPRREQCPRCGVGIEEGSSYCPNCALEIKEWRDEADRKIDWKPYKLRSKQ